MDGKRQKAHQICGNMLSEFFLPTEMRQIKFGLVRFLLSYSTWRFRILDVTGYM